MTPTDSDIIERLARIETKLDANTDHAGRIRRLEILVASIVVALSSNAVGIKLPFGPG